MKLSFSLMATILLFSCSISVIAGQRYRIESFEGMVFKTLPSGQTTVVRVDEFFGQDEVMKVDDDGRVTLIGPFDESYHFAGGSSVEFEEGQPVLLYGMGWVQVPTKTQQVLSFKTPNAQMKLQSGDHLFTYQPDEQSTQHAVFSGSSSIASFINPSVREKVKSGQMSFIKKDYQKGAFPRQALPIGQDTFSQLRNVFAHVALIDQGIETFGQKHDKDKNKHSSGPKATALPVTAKQPVFLSLEEKKKLKQQSRVQRSPAGVVKTTEKVDVSAIPIHVHSIRQYPVSAPSRVPAGLSAPEKDLDLQSLIKKIKDI